MKMYYLGINEGINSAVVLMKDGEVLFAIQEERITREKEFTGFPREAIGLTLKHFSLCPADICRVHLSNKSPEFTRTRESFLRAYDEALSTSDGSLTVSILRRNLLRTKDLVRRVMPPGATFGMRRNREHHGATAQDLLETIGFEGSKICQGDHHFHHAASAYFGRRADPTTPHLILTADGGGDGLCATVYRGERDRLTRLAATSQGHSLGNIYSVITHLMGFNPHEHEYKLMGLSAYADPNHYLSLSTYFRESVLSLSQRNPLHFERCTVEPTSALGPRLRTEFARRRVRFDSIAGAVQHFSEELLLDWVRAAVNQTGLRHVVAAGGVFQNVKANKRIADELALAFFDVMPSPGDETLPFGALWASYAAEHPGAMDNYRLASMRLGPAPNTDDILIDHTLKSRTLAQPEQDIAEMLERGQIVALCRGRMEFGARALGGRSIVADPMSPQIIPRINKMIKQRDFWMPFAPAATVEHASAFITPPKTLPQDGSPFMMHAFETTARRNEIAAGVHAFDQTARLQWVNETSDPDFHGLIAAFGDRTGRYAILNTSFNIHGEPIVMTAKDAIDVLKRSDLDAVVIGDQLVEKKRT